MAAPARLAKAKAGRVPTIVIVDDDTDVLLALSDALGAAIPEAKIFPAESAEVALVFIQEHRADLVISDFRMPRLSGVELADILKQSRKPPATILMTGHPSMGLAYRALNEHDFAAIFSKPFDPAVMAATALRILAKTMGYHPANASRTRTDPDDHLAVGRRPDRAL